MNANKIRKSVIREDLLAITGDYRKAIILNQFIYWSERVSDADKFIEKENEIAQSNGEETRELFYGWMYKSADEMADEIMLGLSASQVRKYIGSLVDMGYLSKRNNPKYKWDRTLQYRVNLVNIAKDLKEKGYPLSDYKITIPDDAPLNAHQCAINGEQRQNQTHSDDEAIPEITTENTNNRDYSSENTNKAFSKEKVNYKDYKAFFEKKVACDETKLPYNYNKKEFDDFIREKVNQIITDIDPEEISASGKVSKIISAFYDEYVKKRGERHPILSDAAYTSVVIKLLQPIQDIIEKDYVLNVERYQLMIERFFDTDYGKHSGNRTDYRISYFFQDVVQRNLMYKTEI